MVDVRIGQGHSDDTAADITLPQHDLISLQQGELARRQAENGLQELAADKVVTTVACDVVREKGYVPFGESNEDKLPHNEIRVGTLFATRRIEQKQSRASGLSCRHTDSSLLVWIRIRRAASQRTVSLSVVFSAPPSSMRPRQSAALPEA